jgi:uncharacterized protein YpmS
MRKTIFILLLACSIILVVCIVVLFKRVVEERRSLGTEHSSVRLRCIKERAIDAVIVRPLHVVEKGR